MLTPAVSNPAMSSTKIFGISVPVSDHDWDKQPSYEHGGGGFRIIVSSWLISWLVGWSGS